MISVEDDGVLSSAAAADRASILIEFSGTRTRACAKKAGEYVFNYETVAADIGVKSYLIPGAVQCRGTRFFPHFISQHTILIETASVRRLRREIRN